MTSSIKAMKKQAKEIFRKYREQEGYHLSDAESDLLNLFNVSDSVEKILNPEYMNTQFTWGQIKKAIKKATER